MIKNLLSGRNLNGWQLRSVLTSTSEFENAVETLKTTPYASSEYTIISGVRKGIILSRNPDGVAYEQILGKSNFDEPRSYIIMTNFDFFFHDIREFFDPTGGGGFGRPTRRIAAQKILNSSKAITPSVLFDTISAKYVIADTVFQAVISVEKKLFNASQPTLT